MTLNKILLNDLVHNVEMIFPLCYLKYFPYLPAVLITGEMSYSDLFIKKKN